jgi:hypothetical protein
MARNEERVIRIETVGTRGQRISDTIVQSLYGYSKKCDEVCKEERRQYIETLKSGGCVVCRSFTRLEFHHVYPAEKKFSIGGAAFAVSTQRFLAELDKCVVLCHLCHGRLHNSKTVPSHIANSKVFQALREALERGKP